MSRGPALLPSQNGHGALSSSWLPWSASGQRLSQRTYNVRGDIARVTPAFVAVLTAAATAGDYPILWAVNVGVDRCVAFALLVVDSGDCGSDGGNGVVAVNVAFLVGVGDAPTKHFPKTVETITFAITTILFGSNNNNNNGFLWFKH